MKKTIGSSAAIGCEIYLHGLNAENIEIADVGILLCHFVPL